MFFILANSNILRKLLKYLSSYQASISQNLSDLEENNLLISQLQTRIYIIYHFYMFFFSCTTLEVTIDRAMKICPNDHCNDVNLNDKKSKKVCV